jgi:hypothetical protein
MQVRARAAPADATCWVCLEPAGERRTRSRRCELQRGCSCRGSAGWAHFPCLLRVTDQQEALGKDGASCPMCKQQYTGELELALRAVCRYKGCPLIFYCIKGQIIPRIDSAPPPRPRRKSEAGWRRWRSFRAPASSGGRSWPSHGARATLQIVLIP